MKQKKKKKSKIPIHLSYNALASMVLVDDDGAGGGVILMHIFGLLGGGCWGPHREPGSEGQHAAATLTGLWPQGIWKL